MASLLGSVRREAAAKRVSFPAVGFGPRYWREFPAESLPGSRRAGKNRHGKSRVAGSRKEQCVLDAKNGQEQFFANHGEPALTC